MNSSDIIAAIALLISILSLAISTAFSARDRANLKAKCVYLPHWEENPAHISVSIVNAGRRPLIVRMWAGAETKEKWVGTYIGESKVGLRLGEHEHYEMKLEKSDLFCHTPDEVVEIRDLWFEDSLGRKHKVKDAAKNLAKLWAT